MIKATQHHFRSQGRSAVLAGLLALALGAALPAHGDVGPGPRNRPPGPPQPQTGPVVTPVKPRPTKPEAKPEAKPEDPKQREQMRAKLLARVREVRAKALSELLRPDDAAIAKVVEISAGFEDRTLHARQEMRQQRQQLEALIKQPKADDAAINKAIEGVMAQREVLRVAEDERSAALRKVLTPAQYAKVMIAWPRINRRIQEQLFKALIQSKEGAAAVDEY